MNIRNEEHGLSRFVFAVIEVRAYEMQYLIEADDFAEAQDKASIGDTISEVELSFAGVSGRDVVEQLHFASRAFTVDKADCHQGSGTWDEIADHPVQAWQYEVANGDTRLGYRAWVAARLQIGD